MPIQTLHYCYTIRLLLHTYVLLYPYIYLPVFIKMKTPQAKIETAVAQHNNVSNSPVSTPAVPHYPNEATYAAQKHIDSVCCSHFSYSTFFRLVLLIVGQTRRIPRILIPESSVVQIGSFHVRQGQNLIRQLTVKIVRLSSKVEAGSKANRKLVEGVVVVVVSQPDLLQIV